MSVMGILTLAQQDQGRLYLMNKVLWGGVGVVEAASVMGLSERQVWRILKAYKEKGAVALVHGNRGHQPPNAVPGEIRQKVINLARNKYAGLNQTHFSEILAEREGIMLSRSVIRNILKEACIASRRQRRPPRFRYRRNRIPREGMLLQMDGSHHDWLEGRGPWLTLLIAVDDATGTVPHALFRKEEDTQGYFMLIEGILRLRGAPLAIYTDRHAVFKHTRPSFRPKDSKGDNRQTQFSRAMKQLGISMIFARTPQGKGRVEKIAGTFQDRLVSEMRLAGASDMAGANRFLEDFLPRFNLRFGVMPSELESAYRRVNSDINLSSILCFHHSRKVLRDNTVRYGWRILQLLPGPNRTSYAGTRVLLREYQDGKLDVVADGDLVQIKEIPRRPLYFDTSLQKREYDFSNIPEWLASIIKEKGRAEAIATPRVSTKSPSPTPRQQTRWEAVQEARSRGLSERATSRLLHMSRKTVRKYMSHISPPVYQLGRRAKVGLVA